MLIIITNKNVTNILLKEISKTDVCNDFILIISNCSKGDFIFILLCFYLIINYNNLIKK